LLMMAKFCGAFLGGVTVQKNLRRSLVVGMIAGAVGFGGFALAPGMAIACVGLFVGGYGIGQLITATNILAGRRFTKHRGSALALLNFSFSLGAMLSALLAAWLLPLFALVPLLECFGGLFLVGGVWMLVEMRGAAPEVFEAEEIAEPIGLGLDRRVYLYFAGLLVLYGGLETCLSGWLTTFALRYGDKTLVVSEYTTLLLWMSLTLGRVGSSVVMMRTSERAAQRASLVLAAVFTACLAFAHTAVSIAVFAVLLGLSLAPFFPATFALLMAERPTARQAGIVLAVSGLGAAALPWLMGVVSTRTGSLQVALVLPFAAAGGLLVMSVFSPASSRSEG
jgi:MFS transporter, FHS family, glucose/mannose:H+ symporter